MRPWGWGLYDKISAPIRRDTKEFGVCVLAQRSHVTIYKQGENPNHKLTMLAPRSQTSSLQNYEKVNICCLSHPVYGVWVFCYGRLLQCLYYLVFPKLWVTLGFTAQGNSTIEWTNVVTERATLWWILILLNCFAQWPSQEKWRFLSRLIPSFKMKINV